MVSRGGRAPARPALGPRRTPQADASSRPGTPAHPAPARPCPRPRPALKVNQTGLSPGSPAAETKEAAVRTGAPGTVTADTVR